MLKTLALLLFTALASSRAAFAQQPPPAVHSALLDHFTGRWILRYTAPGVHSIHDVTGQWVLGHHYLELHEVARERTAGGEAQYEADIFITLDTSPRAYVVQWLDDFGGAVAPSVGYAVPQPNRMRFIFRDASGNVNFINDMRYRATSDSWEWRMLNVNHGKSTLFAQMTLSRAPGGSGR